jgi:Bacterial Ig-like domain (group 3)
MNRTLSSLAAVAVAAAASGGLLVGGATGAAAATNPPWEPDPSSVGGLTFYNSAGAVIISGTITDSPIAAYVEGSTAVRAGDTKATLFAYQPISGEQPTQWSGSNLSASTAYPNAAAPSPVGTATLPVVTGASGDESIGQFAASFATTGSGDYANVYQLRLLTSAPQEGISATYDSADIQITGTTWSEIYPNAGTPTTTTLSASKTSITFGSNLTLTATVSPSTAAGSVTFLDGTTVLKKVTVSGGTASFSTTSLAGGTQKLSASFAPASTGGFAGSVSTKHTVTVKAHATKLTLKASKASLKQGAKLTLTTTVTPAVSGKVTFYDGAKKLGVVAVKKGKATFSTKKLKVAKHTLKAKFAATKKADYAASTSKAVKVKVTKK